MPQQQANNGWTPVDTPPDGWTPVGNVETSSTTGITVPRGMVDRGPDDAVKGFFRRGADTVKGIYHTVTDPPTGEEQKEFPSAFERPALVEHRIVKGVYEGERQAAQQTKEQIKTAQGIKGDPVQKGLAYTRAGFTAASMADPFATGPVTNVNKLSDEGRYREALGQGAFDALSLVAGGRSGREVSAETRLNKLAYATGAESVRPLDHIMPDILETVNKVGKPQTVGELQTVIQKTMSGYERTFNKGLYTTKGQFIPDPIADALEAKAREMPPTAEGRAIAKKLKKAATEYRKPWTAQELNRERMFRQGQLDAFYKKSGTGQMHAMRSNVDTMTDQIVYDTSKDVLYGEMERQHPGQGYRELKQKQSSVLDMQGKFEDHVRKLEATQAKRSGAPLSEKAGVSASAHSGGVTPRAHITELLKRGPKTHADSAVRSAFGPTGAASARRTAVLSLPVASITQGRSATVPLPPGSEDYEGPQQ